MLRIGLLSDTHNYLDPQIFSYFNECDEVWHAGDIGSVELFSELENFRFFRAVWGNIDGVDIRLRCPEHQHFEIEGVRIWMTHIGGTPPKYNPIVRSGLQLNPPDVFICGHSHILKVIRDATLNNMLFINPGAAGKTGFHQVRTCLRFSIHEGKLLDMEVIELGKK